MIALITAGCERIRIGRHKIVAPAGTIAVVNPEEWHDGEQGADEGWAYRTFYPPVPLMAELAHELGGADAPVFSHPNIEDSDLAAALMAARPELDLTGRDAGRDVAARRIEASHRSAWRLQRAGRGDRKLGIATAVLALREPCRKRPWLAVRPAAACRRRARHPVPGHPGFQESDWPDACSLYPRPETASRQLLDRTGARPR
ncbi:AraC family ligand binding domain-containing protein [Mesorhizobium sp.]|uniref:AraC family ligand binding domain-containing protein n=1 Tax=Mesorhizobium sp. TaxID=1871066 RepID=UPI00257DD1F4|nr:AraC family ligand binding domain-containing protein [Mesorhizobium sp.]